MTKMRMGWLGAGAVIAAVAAAQPALGVTIQGGEVNISGATLFADFFSAPASTNDWINADNDFLTCPPNPPLPMAGYYDSDCPPDGLRDTSDQLAPDWTGAGWTGWWLLQYRGVGSGNGLAEFRDFQLCGKLPDDAPAEVGRINRTLWANLGNRTLGSWDADCPVGTAMGGTGTPYCPTSIDIGVMDVPTDWFTQAGSAADAKWSRKPGQSGYGQNPGKSKDVCCGAGASNKLKTLTTGCSGLALNVNKANPDGYTVYDTTIAWVPIAFIANRGVNDDCFAYTELQHLFVSGRLPNGENLVGATRDAGSGTRNGAMNSIGIDPSHGVGDNWGYKNEVGTWSNLGPCHQATNCGGSGIIEDGVKNRRLAVGYTGVAGASRAVQDAYAGRYEVVGVVKDIAGGATCVRPTLNAILDNTDVDAGYQVGGAETFATLGNPFVLTVRVDFDDDSDVDLADFASFLSCFNGPARPPAASFCVRQDIDQDGDVDLADFSVFLSFFNGPNRPPAQNDPTKMANEAAAAFIRNIVLSSQQFDPTGSPVDFNMPSEFLARTYFLTQSVDALPKSDPTVMVNQVGQASFSQALQDYTRANSELAVSDCPAYGSVNNAGLVPVRNNLTTLVLPGAGCPTPPASYDDGSATGPYVYKDSTGVVQSITGNSRLGQRNRVQGDFSNDGLRNATDIPYMLDAMKVGALNFEQTGSGSTHIVPAGGWAGDKGSQVDNVVIVHVIGDFDGDGNFNAEDIRYAADGLAIQTAGAHAGKLDRKAGFVAVDTKWLAIMGDDNYFNTTLANPLKAYALGDARGDIAGSTLGPAKGAQPVGSDGVVDARDIDYLAANLRIVRAFADGKGDWSNLDEAAKFDLSCDMNGDLIVDDNDLTELVVTILGTQIGDVNLDGVVNCDDYCIVNGNQGATNAGWADGDLDQDGDVDGADLAAIQAILPGYGGCSCP